jgi:hypothetical protein
VAAWNVGDAAAREALLRAGMWEALAALRADTPARWGRMSAQQMVEHLEWTFACSTGTRTVGCFIPEELRPKYLAFLAHDRPTPQGFENPALTSGLPALAHAGFGAATAALKREVELYLSLAESSPGALRTHPLFGPIDAELWSRTHYKHVRHHFTQFGLYPDEPA